MKLTVTHSYLAFPVNTAKKMKKLLFSDGDKLVYDLDIRYDPIAPDFTAFVDLRRFMGRELTISIEPDLPLSFRESDDIDADGLGQETFRPHYHFTTRSGWINDPNGLVRDAEGTYHLFYQHNPAAPEWGNMHWGHATSTDLIHWTHRPVALFPDEMGTMFSGSAILDRDGRAGSGKNALLLYYTAAGGHNRLSQGKPYTQCLAYSTDNGKTFAKYAGNPVIPHVAGSNRDPKIVFCEEMGCYILALFLDGSTYGLFRTDDLVHFEKIQQIDLPDDNECPDFYPMTADDGTRHWILSGAHGKYLVGAIRDGQFVPEQGPKSQHTGSRGYAAQTFSDLPDGRRVFLAWDIMSDFPGGMPFACQMGLPTDFSLKKTSGGYVICPAPVKEAECLRRSPLQIRRDGDGSAGDVRGSAVELAVTMPSSGPAVRLSLLGQTLTFDRERMEFQHGKDNKIPLYDENGSIRVRLFFDVCSVEVYSWAYYACFKIVADDNLTHLSLTGDPAAVLEGWDLGRADLLK